MALTQLDISGWSMYQLEDTLEVNQDAGIPNLTDGNLTTEVEFYAEDYSARQALWFDAGEDIELSRLVYRAKDQQASHQWWGKKDGGTWYPLHAIKSYSTSADTTTDFGKRVTCRYLMMLTYGLSLSESDLNKLEVWSDDAVDRVDEISGVEMLSKTFFNETGAGPNAISWPSGIQDGDTVVILVMTPNDTPKIDTTTMTTDGWTAIVDLTRTAGFDSSQSVMVWDCDGTESGTFDLKKTGSITANGYVLHLRGSTASITDAASTSGAYQDNSSRTGLHGLSAPDLTTNTDGSLIIDVYSGNMNLTIPFPAASTQAGELLAHTGIDVDVETHVGSDYSRPSGSYWDSIIGFGAYLKPTAGVVDGYTPFETGNKDYLLSRSAIQYDGAHTYDHPLKGSSGGDLADLRPDATVWEYGDSLMRYLKVEHGATAGDIEGALNELNGTENIGYLESYKTFFGLE